METEKRYFLVSNKKVTKEIDSRGGRLKKADPLLRISPLKL